MTIFTRLLTLLIVSQNIAAATIYKSEDEFGRSIFSNRAYENAEKVKLKEPTTYESHQPATPLRSRNPKPEAEAEKKHTNLLITDPANNRAIRNNAGTLELNIKVEPEVQTGHTLELLMDGNPVRALTDSGSIVLANVDRGTHVFQLRVSNIKSGANVASGPTTTITVLRHSTRH
ncbi:MAG TPA: hypothetical protein DCM54_00480 [Gammaproteobacteria bacterium]|nr:hypothetical protein [Gammaproteobacteria bacterium]